MSMNEDRRRKLEEISNRDAAETDVLLENELEALKRLTLYDPDALRPKVSDSTTFNKMMAIVQDANQTNMNVAGLKSRLEAAGQSVVKIAKEVCNLVK